MPLKFHKLADLKIASQMYKVCNGKLYPDVVLSEKMPVWTERELHAHKNKGQKNKQKTQSKSLEWLRTGEGKTHNRFKNYFNIRWLTNEVWTPECTWNVGQYKIYTVYD